MLNCFVVKWQNTEDLDNKGIRLKLGSEKCESESEDDLVFCSLFKVFQMNSAHMETNLKKEVKGAPYLYSINTTVIYSTF